jgi:hypothetical protein
LCYFTYYFTYYFIYCFIYYFAKIGNLLLIQLLAPYLLPHLASWLLPQRSRHASLPSPGIGVHVPACAYHDAMLRHRALSHVWS